MTGLAGAWLAGFALLAVWVVASTRRARRGGLVSRNAALAAAVLVCGLGALGAYAWGTDIARRGMADIRAETEDKDARSPARARLFLHRVRAESEGGRLRVGYSIDAELRLPRSYGLQEASRGWDLFELSTPGARGLAAIASLPAEPTDTRIVLAAKEHLSAASLATLASTSRSLLESGRCADRSVTAPVAVTDGAGVVFAVVCRGPVPVAALAMERGDGDSVSITPLVWRGRRFRPHHVQLSTGSLLQIGGLADSIPGVELWEVPAPVGHAQLVFPPPDLLASCQDWRRAIVGPLVDSGDGHAPDDSVCVLPFSPPFGLEVRRLVPDVPAIAWRSLWAAAALVVPSLMLLLGLAVRRRSRVTAREFGPALVIAWVSSALAALAVFRLLWAHRIDMLRDYEAVGWRVVQSELSIALVGAAIAATCIAVATRGRKPTTRLGLSILGWVVFGALAGRALLSGTDLGPRWQSLVGQAGISLLLGLAPLWAARASRTARDWIGDRNAALLLVLAVAGSALVARALWPRAVALKLGIAWLAIIASYGCLRWAVVDGVSVRRMFAALAASVAALAASAVFDAGITAAIVCPGFCLAVVMASHDARFSDTALRRTSTYRLDHAPVAVAQAIVAVCAGALLATLAISGLVSAAGGEIDATWSLTLTRAAMGMLVVVALLVAPAGVVAFRRRGLVAALPWLSISGTAVAIWAVRDRLVDTVMATGTQAAHRLSIVLEPGYALLRDDTKFLAGLTAWRETAMPGAASAVDGQGYFGAQLLDPGVLLSVENDYLPILILRETGVSGVLSLAALSLVLVAGLWLVAGERFVHGSAAQRRRALVVAVLGLLCIYQPLAALGALPLTGVAWPGLGVDSPSDLWVFAALLLWIAVWGSRDSGDDLIDKYDDDLRREKRFRRLRGLIVAATIVAALASGLVLARTSAFAARRPAPVADGAAVAPFDRLVRAVTYARGLRCDDPDEPLYGEPSDPPTARFHASASARLQSARPAGDIAMARFHQSGECTGTLGPWQLEPSGDRCVASLDIGWPRIRLSARRGGASSCAVELPSRPLRALEVPVQRPFENARIRLVSRAMGVAATDLGELVSGHVVVRMRRGAGAVDAEQLDAGIFAAERVRFGEDLAISIAGDRVVLLSRDDPEEPPELFFRDGGDSEPVKMLSAESGGWSRRGAGDEVELDRTALLVVNQRPSRSLWLFRPATAWSDKQPTPVVDPLVADDSWTVRGERRRFYLYGGSLPEVGWVNRFRARGSMGLDGWVRVAMREYRDEGDRPDARAMCGTLDPPDVDLDQVCRRSAADGALVCRIAVQPELSLRLRHLTELISVSPDTFAPNRKSSRSAVPVRADYTLVRGDTGEIVAQGEFVPGRESSAYAPATPQLEQRLIRYREDRDPVTGKKLPAGERGESSGEKIDWNAPIAIGSTLKPMLARGLELADPWFSRNLSLQGSRFAGAECRGGRSHAILGHCPPTDSLWSVSGRLGTREFLSRSANWFQAAIGLLGTAVPGGTWGFGSEPAEPGPFVERNVGDHRSDKPLWTRHGDRDVIRGRRIDVDALRHTPMWSRFEQLLGRPLCDAGSKHACAAPSQRMDTCAGRSLPVDQPSADMRHLVSLGPSQFDFYPELADRSRTLASIPTREYLQFLRGSGLHPVSSLAQLTDTFKRLVFEYDRAPPADGGYRLAASWFPAPRTGGVPRVSCANAGIGSTVRDGLCEAVRSGTARALSPLLSERGVVVYGAKTGTVDSLADVAENRAACKSFNEAHTIPDRDAVRKQQPYWLTCSRRASHDDSLLLLSFGIVDASGTVVPMTLGLRFQRSGSGLATHVARHYVAAIRDYFAPEGTAVGR